MNTSTTSLTLTTNATGYNSDVNIAELKYQIYNRNKAFYFSNFHYCVFYPSRIMQKQFIFKICNFIALTVSPDKMIQVQLYFFNNFRFYTIFRRIVQMLSYLFNHSAALWSLLDIFCNSSLNGLKASLARVVLPSSLSNCGNI